MHDCGRRSRRCGAHWPPRTKCTWARWVCVGVAPQPLSRTGVAQRAALALSHPPSHACTRSPAPRQHEGWYCKSDEAFLTETQVHTVVGEDGSSKKVRPTPLRAACGWLGPAGYTRAAPRLPCPTPAGHHRQRTPSGVAVGAQLQVSVGWAVIPPQSAPPRPSSTHHPPHPHLPTPPMLPACPSFRTPLCGGSGRAPTAPWLLPPSVTRCGAR